MTAATATSLPAGLPPTPVAFGRLMVSEWTKIRSVRSTMWALVLLFVLTIGFTTLITGLTASQWAGTDASDRQNIVADPVSFIIGAGFQLSQLTICVLGVMVIASEYSTGMIRASLLAVPKRLNMLIAKCAVFAILVFGIGLVVAFTSFFIGAAIMHSHAPVAIGDPGVFRAVVGAGIYLSVLGLFSLAVGALLRNTGAGITGVVGFVLVLAPLAQLLPGSLGKHVHAYLPSEAGQLIARAHQDKNDLLAPWQGLGVFCLWTAGLLIAAAYQLKRRDA